MTALTKDAILETLKAVHLQDGENIVDAGLVSEVVIANGKVYFAVLATPESAEAMEGLRLEAESAVKAMEGVSSVAATLTAERAPQQPTPQQSRSGGNGAGVNGGSNGAQAGAPAGAQSQAIPGVKTIVAVASGKGGVGKSTTSVNLALGLQALGLKVGLLDADVYGPSMPRLLGINGEPRPGPDNQIMPLEAYGLKVMSMGFLVAEGTAVVWRGPMVMSALSQMLRQVMWGELDCLILDMPPGTGDVQLTMVQQAPLSGAIIVSTPQDLALIDARKGIDMFSQVSVPILGVIENMSYFACPKCGERSDIFGHGGAAQEAQKMGVPFLGEVPLTMSIRETSDQGLPIVASNPDDPNAIIFKEIASKCWELIEEQTRKAALTTPSIVIE